MNLPGSFESVNIMSALADMGLGGDSLPDRLRARQGFPGWILYLPPGGLGCANELEATGCLRIGVAEWGTVAKEDT